MYIFEENKYKINDNDCFEKRNCVVNFSNYRKCLSVCSNSPRDIKFRQDLCSSHGQNCAKIVVLPELFSYNYLSPQITKYSYHVSNASSFCYVHSSDYSYHSLQ